MKYLSKIEKSKFYHSTLTFDKIVEKYILRIVEITTTKKSDYG